MMETPPKGPEHTRRLIELVTLALASSEVGKTLKAETIRQFVQFRFRELYDGTHLDLGPLWTSLLAEPGMSEFKLAPAFLVIKEWEPRMATEIVLPQPLQALDRTLVQRNLARIAVPEAELDPLLYPALPQAPEAPAPEPPKPAAEAPPPAVEPKKRPLTPARKAILAVSSAVFAGALAVLGATLLSPPGTAYATAKLDPILKLEAARRVGHALTGTIADPRWNDLPAAERTRLLVRLLSAVEPEGVKSVVLRDRAGTTRGLASSVGGDRVVRVE